MKQHYFHPNRVKEIGMPVINGKGFYEVMVHFLGLIEKLVPESVIDLENFTREYRLREVEGDFEKLDSLPSLWGDLTACNIPGAKYTVENIKEWSEKFRLENIFYKELAWWSVVYYYEATDEIKRIARINEAKRFTRAIGMSESEYWGDRVHETPYQERLSLKEGCFLEEESRAIYPENVEKGIEGDFFGRYLPFNFAPDGLMLGLFPYSKKHQQYERLLLYYEMLTHALKQGEDIKSWSEIHGHGWDPRTSTWYEFEQLMGDHFSAYKKMYRSRTESWMQKSGYIKAKEKRNMSHFIWLVRYRIQGWSLREVADFYSTDLIVLNEDTISHGVKSAAAWVFLDIS